MVDRPNPGRKHTSGRCRNDHDITAPDAFKLYKDRKVCRLCHEAAMIRWREGQRARRYQQPKRYEHCLLCGHRKHRDSRKRCLPCEERYQRQRKLEDQPAEAYLDRQVLLEHAPLWVRNDPGARDQWIADEIRRRVQD